MSNLFQRHKILKNSIYNKKINPIFKLLRWDKPSGRLILLIPAGWSLWLTPIPPPDLRLILTIIAGTVFISGAGCIANDLWDQKIDRKVNRTKSRPLVLKTIKESTAYFILFIMLSLSLLTIFFLPISSRILCLIIAIISLPFILIYPSTKRWIKYPQAFLSLCWGFAVLIPWAASESNLKISVPLICCWLSTMIWTFGFDTVYAIQDRNDDLRLGLNSSALSLGEQIITTVSICYASASILLGFGALTAGVKFIFWPFWLISSIGMQREIWVLKNFNNSPNKVSKHFGNQVLIGNLILLGLIIGRN